MSSFSDRLNRALGLGKQHGYACEHGEPCEPGGITECAQCPKDSQLVRYRPVYAKWPDACKHNRPRDRFLGTIEHDGKTYDVYVYQDNELTARPDFHICMRYGPEDSHYVSPGNVDFFVKLCSTEQWRFAGGRVPDKYKVALPLIERFLKGGRQ